MKCCGVDWLSHLDQNVFRFNIPVEDPVADKVKTGCVLSTMPVFIIFLIVINNNLLGLLDCACRINPEHTCAGDGETCKAGTCRDRKSVV